MLRRRENLAEFPPVVNDVLNHVELTLVCRRHLLLHASEASSFAIYSPSLGVSLVEQCSSGALQLEVNVSLTLWICGALFGAVVSWLVSEVLTALKNRWKR
jgi:hypothetical protein